MDWGVVDRYAKSLIKEAAHKIRVSFFEQIHIDSKANENDLVTNIDRDVEQFFIQQIKSVFPEHKIMGEEGFGDEIESLEGIVWIVDPIDGTMNFVHQQQNFAISLGIYQDGIGVLGYIYDVVKDELFSAKKGEGAYKNDERLPKLNEVSVHEAIIGLNARWIAPNRYTDHEKLLGLVLDCRGTRSYGSAALELAYVSSGKLDAYISMRLSPWDIAGGIVIAREAGAIATNFQGADPHLLGPDTFIVANPGMHYELLENYIETKQP